jgi:hypothetical protein
LPMVPGEVYVLSRMSMCVEWQKSSTVSDRTYAVG